MSLVDLVKIAWWLQKQFIVRPRVNFSLQQFSEERARNPFVLCDGKSNQGPKVALKRRDETLIQGH